MGLGMGFGLRRIGLAATFWGMASAIVSAEPAFVGSGMQQQGQAFTFSHRGTCYALLPNHVSPRRQTLSLSAGNPARLGKGTMTPSRFPLADFALASVEGALALDCSPSWTSLSSDLGRVLPDGGAATLTTVRPSGVVERVQVTMSPVTYEHIGVTPADPALRGTLGQGRSGSLLSVGDVPVGIVIELPGDTGAGELRVLRIDAIKGRLDRYLRGSEPAVPASPVLVEADAIPFQVVSWNVEPATPDHNPMALAQPNGGPFIAGEAGGVVRLRLRLLDDHGVAATRTVQGVRLQTDPSADATVPKTVRLYAPRSEDDRSPRRLNTGHVGPGGNGKISLRPIRVEWLDIELRDAWNPAKPVRMDKLVIVGR